MKRLSNTILNVIVLIGVALTLIVATTEIYQHVVERRYSNRQRGIDCANKFEVALVTLNGETKKIKIVSWRDFIDGDEVQFTDTNGVTYLTHYSNVVLISEDK